MPQDLENSIILSDGLTLKYQVAYVKSFRRSCLVVAVFQGEKLRMNLVSTDTNMKPETVLRYYRARFQQEHLFRDAKQYTGFGDCPARDEQSLNFHANATLTAVNLARINAPTDQPFSLTSVKRNRLIALNIFRQLNIEPNLIENPDFIRKILKIGCIAA